MAQSKYDSKETQEVIEKMFFKIIEEIAGNK